MWWKGWLILFLGFGMGFVCRIGAENNHEDIVWEAFTVKHGCAHYDIMSGKFEWNAHK